MGRQALLKRIEQAEETVKGLSRDQPSQFDEDALAIYSAEAYLDATMEPTYHEVEPTAAYARGKELRDALCGPIIPAHFDEHIKRYTRASGEFELAFGREPRVGDILRYGHVKLMHSSENYSRVTLWRAITTKTGKPGIRLKNADGLGGQPWAHEPSKNESSVQKKL